eukprot:gene2807-5249_t
MLSIYNRLRYPPSPYDEVTTAVAHELAKVDGTFESRYNRLCH